MSLTCVSSNPPGSPPRYALPLRARSGQGRHSPGKTPTAGFLSPPYGPESDCAGRNRRFGHSRSRPPSGSTFRDRRSCRADVDCIPARRSECARGGERMRRRVAAIASLHRCSQAGRPALQGIACIARQHCNDATRTARLDGGQRRLARTSRFPGFSRHSTADPGFRQRLPQPLHSFPGDLRAEQIDGQELTQSLEVFESFVAHPGVIQLQSLQAAQRKVAGQSTARDPGANPIPATPDFSVRRDVSVRRPRPSSRRGTALPGSPIPRFPSARHRSPWSRAVPGASGS